MVTLRYEFFVYNAGLIWGTLCITKRVLITVGVLYIFGVNRVCLFSNTDVFETRGFLWLGKLSEMSEGGGEVRDRSFGGIEKDTAAGAEGRRIRVKRGEITDRQPPRIPLDSALNRFTLRRRPCNWKALFWRRSEPSTSKRARVMSP